MLSLLLALVATAVKAQEFSASAGVMLTPDPPDQSYSWQLDYRQNLGTYFAASAAWINEGHVPGHHRDGWAVQGWGRLPVSDSLVFAFGLGTFRYYDTQTLAQWRFVQRPRLGAHLQPDRDLLHPVARGFTGSRMNRINPSDNIPTTTVMVGVGYNIGDRSVPAGAGAGHLRWPMTMNSPSFSARVS